jgi:hypothetical protein
MTIGKSTIRKMGTNFAITLPMFAIVVYPFWRRLPESWPIMLATVILMPLMFSLLPLIVDYGQQVRARKAEERALWREAYQRSPEANLLNLND